MTRGQRIYAAIGAGSLAAYVLAAVVSWQLRDFASSGPLALDAPALVEPLDDGLTLPEVEARCRQAEGFNNGSGYTMKIVGGEVDGRLWYGCYEIAPNGSVWHADVVGLTGERAPTSIVRASGAWKWIGTVKSVGELVLGGFGVAAIFALFYTHHRRRPEQRKPVVRWLMRAVIGVGIVLVFALWVPTLDRVELVSTTIVAVVTGIFALAWLAGRRYLLPEAGAAPPRRPGDEGAPGGVDAGAEQQPGRGASTARSGAGGTMQQAASASGGPDDLELTPRHPGELPNFADVGGMDELKAELQNTIGMLLSHPGEADRFGVTFNGLLLHGPPGVGKSFIAQATAGEFGMNLIPVTAGDLVSSYVGQSARNIARCFEIAAANLPCLLFFDEFDSIAIRRDDEPSQENRRAVNQLLQSIEKWRGRQDLIVMAATNHLDLLDAAVIRPGRFDRHIRVDLPDREARISILQAQLDERPCGDIDYDDLALRTQGLTPAAIASVVNAAAMAAYRSTVLTGTPAVIRHEDLRAAIDQRGGQDRPTVEDWSWDRLVLSKELAEELRQLTALLRDPDLARSYGVDPPTGVLLAGPPGTGKTTIARVLAAESNCSFYALTAGDLTSKWVGESERLISQAFERARRNAPSIVFIDEIDSIGGTRGTTSSFDDRQLTQLLTEMDGMGGRGRVLVVGATNRPDTLDPALTRGGRLSRTIWVQPPDRAARLALLTLFTRRMPLSDVSLDDLASRTEGMTGADLEALCSQAAVEAMRRGSTTSGGEPTITRDDIDAALRAVRDGKTAPRTAPRVASKSREGGYL